MPNNSLNAAKVAKDDEYYTKLSDIEVEMIHYGGSFNDKTVYLNCDDPTKSNFWLYFDLNFSALNIKRLISTHYVVNGQSYIMEITRGTNKPVYKKTPLNGNGDFRSQECIDILTQADIVVTNPPFSLSREHTTQLIKHDVDFIVIGPLSLAVKREIFTHVYNGDLFIGHNKPKGFIKPNGDTKLFGNIVWYTNIKTKKHTILLNTRISVNDKNVTYQKYTNYDAINVNEVKHIPMDYQGPMGVPISFLEQINLDQFKIIKAYEISTTPQKPTNLIISDGKIDDLDSMGALGDFIELDGPTRELAKFDRLVIQHIDPK